MFLQYRKRRSDLPACNVLVRIRGIALLAGMYLIAMTAPALAELPLMFNNGTVNTPPPGSMMAAGYISIKNESDKDLRIVSASSDAFKKVELHLTEMSGDVAKMRKQEFLEVKAGQELQLKRYGNVSWRQRNQN